MNTIIKKIKKAIYLFPLRPRFFIFLVLIALSFFAFFYVQNNFSSSKSFLSFFLFLCLAALAAIVSLLLISSFLFYLFSTRNFIAQGDATYITIPENFSTNAAINFYVGLPSKKRSIFNTIKVGLCLNEEMLTGFEQLFPADKEELYLGNYSAVVPENLLGTKVHLENLPMGQYQITRSYIIFEDYFGLLRFSYSEEEENLSFFIYSDLYKKRRIVFFPKSAIKEQEAKHKTVMEGELLDFKKYTPGSDSARHIVWRIFARTGQLIIKKPEMDNPNSSEIPFFSNFYTDYIFPENQLEMAAYLIDQYKIELIKLISSIKEKGLVPLYFPEHLYPILETNNLEQLKESLERINKIDADKRNEIALAMQNWQSQYNIKIQYDLLCEHRFLKKQYAKNALIVVHSLQSNIIDQILSFQIFPTEIFFFPLSKFLFIQKKEHSFIKDLFFIREKQKDYLSLNVKSRLKYNNFLKIINENEKKIRQDCNKAGIRLIDLRQDDNA